MNFSGFILCSGGSPCALDEDLPPTIMFYNDTPEIWVMCSANCQTESYFYFITNCFDCFHVAYHLIEWKCREKKNNKQLSDYFWPGLVTYSYSATGGKL